MTVKRYIREYDKKTECLVGEYIIEKISLKDLQDLFRVPADNPMYDCYPITERELTALLPYISDPHIYTKGDLMLECDDIDVDLG